MRSLTRTKKVPGAASRSSSSERSRLMIPWNQEPRSPVLLSITTRFGSSSRWNQFTIAFRSTGFDDFGIRVTGRICPAISAFTISSISLALGSEFAGSLGGSFGVDVCVGGVNLVGNVTDDARVALMFDSTVCFVAGVADVTVEGGVGLTTLIGVLDAFSVVVVTAAAGVAITGVIDGEIRFVGEADDVNRVPLPFTTGGATGSLSASETEVMFL